MSIDEVTLMISISMWCKFLPVQVIIVYRSPIHGTMRNTPPPPPPPPLHEGKASGCLPKFNFPESVHITYSGNHCSNLDTFVEVFEKVRFPYLEDITRVTGLPEKQRSG